MTAKTVAAIAIDETMARVADQIGDLRRDDDAELHQATLLSLAARTVALGDIEHVLLAGSRGGAILGAGPKMRAGWRLLGDKWLWMR